MSIGPGSARAAGAGTISLTAGTGVTSSGTATSLPFFAAQIWVKGTTAYVTDRLNQVLRTVNTNTDASAVIAGTGVAGYTGDAGPATAATLGAPKGVAVDSAGDTFIADSSNEVIRMIAATTCSSSCAFGLATTAGDIYTILGNGTFGTFTNATAGLSEGLRVPWGLTVDSAGDLIVANRQANEVVLLAASSCASGCVYGLSALTAGYGYLLAGSGTFGYSGDGAAGPAAHLENPLGVAVDAAGNVLLADGSNERVRMVAATTCASACAYGLSATTKGYIYTIGGSGTAGYSGDGGAATSAALQTPESVAVDSAGDVVIADLANNRIRMIAATTCASACAYGLSATTKWDMYTVAGSGVNGYSGDGAAATSAHLNSPVGVSVDASGNLLALDQGNDRVRMVAAAACASSCAYGLSSMTAGYIYTVMGNGSPGRYGGDGAAATAANLNTPTDVAIDSGDDVIVTDHTNSRVRLIAAATCASSCAFGLSSTVAGDIYTVAGTGTAGYSGDGGPATSAKINGPYGAIVDAGGDLVISDANRIRLVAHATCASACPYGLASTVAGDIYTIGGNGTAGYMGDGTLATGAEMSTERLIALDSSGDVLIADTSNNVVRLIAAASCSSACPYGLATTTKGYIYTVAGNGTSGYTGDAGVATSAELSLPRAVTVDAAGNLIIADTNNSVVRMVAATTCSSACAYGLASTTANDIYTIAGTGSVGSGGDGAAGTSATFDTPYGVGPDLTGNLLIADTANDKVRLLAGASCSSGCPYGLASMTAGYIYSVAGAFTATNGEYGNSGDGGQAVSAMLWSPWMVAVDGSNDLIVADSGNDEIRQVVDGVLQFGAAPATPALPALTLNGGAQTLKAPMTGFSVQDFTDSGSGWNVTVQGNATGGHSPTFAQYCPVATCGTDSGPGYVPAGRTLPASSLTLSSSAASFAAQNAGAGTAPSLSCASGCSMDSATPVKVATAAAGTGSGGFAASGFGATSVTASTPSTIRVLRTSEVYRVDLVWTLSSGP